MVKNILQKSTPMLYAIPDGGMKFYTKSNDEVDINGQKLKFIHYIWEC